MNSQVTAAPVTATDLPAQRGAWSRRGAGRFWPTNAAGGDERSNCGDGGAK